MTRPWEDMTADEKLAWLRQNIENLRGHLMGFVAEMESGQRGLNHRIVQLEQALKSLERRPPKGG
jgi:exonuclease VII small subunit